MIGLLGRMGDRGNVAVEFAMVAPLLVTLLLGMADFGIAAHEKSRLAVAARAGLQAVLTAADDTAGAQLAATRALGGAEAEVEVVTECVYPGGVGVACTEYCSMGYRRQVVTVTVSRTHTLLVPWPGFGEGEMDLAASAYARVK